LQLRVSSTIFSGFRLLLTVSLFCFGFVAQGQLCTGSLGDPIVNITFGAGQGNAPELGSSITDYSYSSADCPADGSYSIRNKSSQCFGNTWHNLTGDHTGDAGGYFMLVNASYTPGNFYVQTISGLCANTTYEFAAWMMNVILNAAAIQPNITFRIETLDGTVLSEYNTGDIPASNSPRWKQYGFYFKTPEEASTIVLKMTNNAPGGIGNDIALDDITFRPCGPTLTVASTFASDTIDMCQEKSFPVEMGSQQTTGFANPVYFWQQSRDSGLTWQDVPGANSNTLRFQSSKPGAYWFRYSAAEKQNSNRQACRVASNIITINVHPTPVSNAGADKNILKGFVSRLGSYAAQAGYVYNWTPALYMDSSTSARPQIQPEADVTYTLTTLSPWGCSSTDDVVVKVVDQLYIPNAFTPNGDGRNDVWRIPLLDAEMGAQVRLYNRYGQLVYAASGENAAWDGRFNGKPQPAGSYIYNIQFKSDYPAVKGTVHLLR
jgi:gliding motility-associated-like protein